MILLEDRVKEASRLLMGDRVSSCYTIQEKQKIPSESCFYSLHYYSHHPERFFGGERKCLYGWPLSKAHKKDTHSALICS